MELIIERNQGTSHYDKEKKIVHYKFWGLVNATIGKEVLKTTLEFAKKKPVLGIHCDLTEITGTFSMLNEYLTNEYFPVMIKLGLKCQSMIVSNDAFTQYAANLLIQKMGSFCIQTFNDKEKGYNWVVETVESK